MYIIRFPPPVVFLVFGGSCVRGTVFGSYSRYQAALVQDVLHPAANAVVQVVHNVGIQRWLEDNVGLSQLELHLRKL